MGRKIFLVLALLMVALTSFSQAGHLKFKGVPIDGTLREFVAKMKAAGFSYLGEKDGTAILKGEFAAVKGCTIGASVLKSTNNVNVVAVLFPSAEEWSTLESRYLQLKSMLTEKYGNPADCVEEFSPSVDNDLLKFQAVQLNMCTYYTIFSTEKGDIELSVSYDDGVGAFVRLRYLDRINTDAARAKAMEDL